MVDQGEVQIAVECGDMKGRSGYTSLGAVWVMRAEALAGPPTHQHVAVWALSRRLVWPGQAGLFLDPADARRVAGAMLDVAKLADGQGYTQAQTEACVGLVRSVLDRWGEEFENAEHDVNGGDLVDWLAQEFLPGAFGALEGRSQCA